MNKFVLLISTILVTSSAFAGGSIFGGNKTRSSNPDGVSSINVHICDGLSCPDVIIKKGDCENIPNASMKYGVCTCDEGYHVEENKCIPTDDKCKNVVLTDCQKSCDPVTGTIENKEEGLCTITGINNAGYCSDGKCLNPCETAPISNCKTCTPESGKSVCTECENGYVLDEGTHTCTSSNEKFQGANGVFYDCSENSLTVVTSATECAKCDNTNTPREMVTYEGNQYCSLVNCPDGYWKGTWQDNDAVCFKCSESNGWISTTATECAKCDNTDTPRKMITYEESEYCAIATCPDGQFQASHGACKDCSTTGVWRVIDSSECAKCGDAREYVEDACVLPLKDGELRAGIWTYQCSELNPLITTAEQCARCDNTDTPREMNGETCTLIKPCPEGYWKTTGDNSGLGKGGCLKCASTAVSYMATSEECAKCDDTDTPRKMFNGRCVPTTPCSEEQFLGQSGVFPVCYSCSETWTPAFSSEEECARCGSQRTYNTETKKCSLAS